MVIGITGTNGAGKGTVVEYLVQKGFKHYSVRGELLAELERRGLPTDRPHLGALGNELRAEHGAGYFMTLFIERAAKEGVANIALESLRSVGEAATLKEAGGVLIATDADRKVRYERVVVRGSDTDKVDYETWVAQEEREWGNAAENEMNIPAVIALADYTLTNNGTLEELHAQIDAILTKIQG